MKVYKNVGVYVLCRIGKYADAESYHHNAKANYFVPSDEVWENIIFYTDDIELGKVSDRANLQKLINDAMFGKIDRIYIHTMWDFWHNPQRLFDTVRNLNSLPNPVNMTVNSQRKNPPMMMSSMDELGLFYMLQEILANQETENSFMFAAANWDYISDKLKKLMVSSQIEADMLYSYFIDFQMSPRDVEWADLQKEIGLSDEDINCVRECWIPSDEGLVKILNWSENQILHYYLA